MVQVFYSFSHDMFAIEMSASVGTLFCSCAKSCKEAWHLLHVQQYVQLYTRALTG
jgi:hypothetical protein